MKKLLTTITLSALVGTSASSLQPVFRNSNVNNNLKSNQLNNKDISIKNENDKNPFIPVTLSDIKFINSITVANNGTVYVGTDNGLYKSSDGINFKPIGNLTNKKLTSLATTNSGIVYVGTSQNLFSINFINFLLKINNDGFYADEKKYKYGGVIYNSAQKIDIKDKLVETAILDSKKITLPITDLDILVGEHTLILTLKDEYKKYANWFGGDNNSGEVTYKLWVKTSIDKKDINYSTNRDDTDLTDLSLGFISNSGNTNNCQIIQTKSKEGTGTHNAILNMDFKDILIDFDLKNSFYVKGNVDSSNNFIEDKKNTKQPVTKSFSITSDGIYHLHLVDAVGNTYDSYLELGENNWKLKGNFDDSELDRLKTKLNVNINLNDPKQLGQATGWLTKYDNFVQKLFEATIKSNGKGFEQDIRKDLANDFKWFLKPLTYDIAKEPNFDDGLDKALLVKTITNKAEEILNKGLDKLPKNLNINTSNVVNKTTLDSYSTWINGYKKFIDENKILWISDIVKVASRGFATEEQNKDIEKHLNNLEFKNYLEEVTWTPNFTSNGYDNKYLQHIKLDKLKTDTINWVNQNLPDIDKSYQNAIKQAESGLNLHGYSIDKILNGKPKPQTKNEIDKFADGQSYHDWLQSQANIKFHGWQLAMGFGIAIPLLLVVVAIAWVIRSRTNPKYHGYWRGKKEDKKEDKLLIKSIKSPKKENKK